MDRLMVFVVAVLATWRVTHLLAHEDGPADSIFRLRRQLGESFVGSLMDCFNCLSLWIAAVAAIFPASGVLTWVGWWLALSGGACLLERLGRGAAGMDHGIQPAEGEPDVLR